jgi:hypothetical protein
VLISPEGQSYVLNIRTDDKVFGQSLKDELNLLLYSKIRQKLQNLLIDKYAVALLFNSSDEAANTKAEKAATAALTDVSKKMDLMPKAIKEPPVLLTISYEERLMDPLLLWTLGLNTDHFNKPYAAIFYGKARWLGPLFKGEEISKNNLREILLVVGADCECGLDKNWLRGTLLPMVWVKNKNERISKNLGFDPQNPLVQMEVNRIMLTNHSRMDGGIPNPQIHEEMLSEDFPRKGIDYAQSEDNNKTTPANSETIKDGGENILDRSLFLTAGILASFLVIGAIIIIRLKKR